MRRTKGMRDDDETRRPTAGEERERMEGDDERRRSEVEGQRESDDEEDAIDLPQREAMSLLLDPGGLLGGGLMPNAPAVPATSPTAAPPSAPAPGTEVATPAGPISMPNVPVPAANPDGTYNPDTSSTAKT